MNDQPHQEPQIPVTITSETPPQLAPTVVTAKAAPVLGFIGLGLAVVGTILACIPAILIVGLVVLFAAFIVSLVAIFKKNTAKWPAIAGLVLSVLAGIIGSIIFIIALAVNLADRANGITPKTMPPATQQPADSSDDKTSTGRPLPEQIAEGVKLSNHEGGLHTYDDMPDFYPCVGDFVYKSKLSDETVRLLVDGYDPLPEERDLATKVIQDSVFTCDPQPTDKYRKDM